MDKQDKNRLGYKNQTDGCQKEGDWWARGKRD